MVKNNLGHLFNNFYWVYKKRNYSVPYKFAFGQIIRTQFTPTDRFKIFWKDLIEKHSWQINKKSCKIVFHNIPDRFMTDSKILGNILMRNIPDIFGRDSKIFAQNHLVASYCKTILMKRLQENSTLMYGGKNSVIFCDWWHFL